jgi:hypothetical protein
VQRSHTTPADTSTNDSAVKRFPYTKPK